MLEQMRSAAGTWVARVLMLLLILSFGLWGIGDYIRPKPDTTAATVGKVEISDFAFRDQYRFQLNAIQRQTGNAIGPEIAKQFGIPDRVLNEMIDQSLFEQEARRLGLDVSDVAVVDQIREMPAFRGAGGFNRLTYETALRNAGLTEAMFVSQLRGGMLRSQIVDALSAGVDQPPEIAVETLYKLRNQRRVVEYMTIPAAALARIPEPTESELADYYKANQLRYAAPEYRAINYAVLTPGALGATLTVDDQQIADDYAARRNEFTVPEKRTVEQAVYPDEAAAKAARERIAKGEDFAAVAKDTLNRTPEELSLGTVTQSDLPGEIGPAAFALAKDAVSEPVQSPFGWHLVRVTAIQPGSETPLEQVRDKLKFDIQQRLGAEQIYKLLPQIEDRLAGGASLEDTAKAFNFTLHKIDAVDARGFGPDDKPVADLPPNPRELLDQAFQLPEHNDLQVTELRDGSLMIARVEKITPEAPRPLDQIKDRVTADWKRAEADKAGDAQAKALAEKVKGGTDFATVAAEVKGEVQRTPAIDAQGQAPADAGTFANPLSPALLSQVFRAKKDEALSGRGPQPDQYVVARVVEIVEPPYKADDAQVAALRQELGQAQSTDVVSGYLEALKTRYPVNIHQAVVDRSL